MEKQVLDIPVVVRRVVDAEQFEVKEPEPVELTAKHVSIISHRSETYLVIPLDEGFTLDGDRVKEDGYSEEHAKSMIIKYFGRDKKLSEEVWRRIIKKVNLGVKVMLTLDGMAIIEE